MSTTTIPVTDIIELSDLDGSLKKSGIQSNGPYNTDDAEVDYPEGRVRAWSTVLGAWLMLLCAIGIIYAFGVFEDLYSASYLSNYSASEISWIGGLQMFLELACGPIGGKLMEGGHFKLVVTAGAFLYSFSLFMSSLAKPQQYYQILLSQGLGMGFGIGLMYLPVTVVIASHFQKRKALALGIVDSSGSLGGVIFPIMLNKLVQGSVGFAWGIRAAAFIAVGCFIVSIILMSDPSQRKSTPIPMLNPVPHVVAPARPFWAAAGLTDTVYLLIVAGGFFACLGMQTPLTYIQLFARKHGISTQLSFYALAIINFAGMFGRIIPNYFADKYGALNVYIIIVALNGAVCFAMLGSVDPAGLAIFSVIYGFFSAGTAATFVPVIAALPGYRAYTETRMGMSLAPSGVAFLIGPPIVGALLGRDYAWWKGITFSSITIMFGAVLIGAAKVVQDRRQRLD